MMQPDDPRVVYADIIDHPHYQSKTRSHMSLYDRAAQFSAFDALAGYSDMIAEEERTTESQIVLDESEISLLNQKLGMIEIALKNGENPAVTFVVFVPDKSKSGGKYMEITDVVKSININERKIILSSKRTQSGGNQMLLFDNILAIHYEWLDRT